MCLILKVDGLICHPICIHDQCCCGNSLGKLMLGLTLIEFFAHLDARVAPNARLHLGGILAGLGHSPSSPAEADAACLLDALLKTVRIHLLQNWGTMGPTEFLQPLFAFGDLFGFVIRFDGAPLEEIRHDNIVPARSEGVAESLVITSVGAEDVMHHNDA